MLLFLAFFPHELRGKYGSGAGDLIFLLEFLPHCLRRMSWNVSISVSASCHFTVRTRWSCRMPRMPRMPQGQTRPPPRRWRRPWPVGPGPPQPQPPQPRRPATKRRRGSCAKLCQAVPSCGKLRCLNCHRCALSTSNFCFFCGAFR